MPAVAFDRADQRSRRLKEGFSRSRGQWRAIYGGDEAILASRRSLHLQALEAFSRAYGGSRKVVVSRAPGRINLLGNHIDHRGGSLNYMAINRETVVVASPRQDDRVVACTADPERFRDRSFRIGELLPPAERGDWPGYITRAAIDVGDWGNFVRAPVLYLQDQFPDVPLKGMDLAVAGDIPVAAGLSSSSALVVAVLEAALACSGLALPFEEKAEFCGRAEWYVGTRGGSGDHAAILYCRKGSVLSVRFFPLQMEEVPFPKGYRVVSCNSFVEHHDPGAYNERVATYEIGLRLVRRMFPEYAGRLAHLRDLNAGHLGVPLQDIYCVLKALPERASRADIPSWLPDLRADLNSIFATHDEPEDGYRVRQVVLYGLAECARAALCRDLLKQGDVEGFGRLKYRSHDGDRRFRTSPSGEARPVDNRISDADLDALIADLDSRDPARVETAQIHLQPGGYDCSCEELDRIVDIAAGVAGVAGAGLTGGGLGGCVLAIVKEEAVADLVRALNAEYYGPRGLKDGTLVCAGVEGACVL